jgi:glutamate:GABA antiporter
MEKKRKKTLGVFSLVMINIIAVDSIRALPISAEYGWSLIFYYILGAILFMIPSALAAAELATGWPNKGGAYVWVREAFGRYWAFWVASLLWVYNIVWYPTILSLLVSTTFYLISPTLAHNKELVFIAIILLYWFAMALNSFGMRISALVSTIGSIFGTLLPIAIIIMLGFMWMVSGKHIAIPFTWSKVVPDMSTMSKMAVLTGMLFGMVGLEMSAVHANEVKNPQRNYPVALLVSVLLIIISSILGSLAIAIVIPQSEINLSVALIESFDIFLKAYHLQILLPFIAICIVVSGLSGVSAWIIGPCKCMLIASEDGLLPAVLAKTNNNGVPMNLMLLQGFIFTLIALLFLFFPGFNSSYWLLTAMTAELSVLFYIMIFLSLIKLRVSKSDIPRNFKIPGGLVGVCIVGGCGLLTCIFVFIVGLYPPSQIPMDNPWIYELTLCAGIMILCIIPLIFSFLFKR